MADSGLAGLGDFGFCKNEAIVAGGVSFSLFLIHIQDSKEVFECQGFLEAAGLLKLGQLGGGALELAREALAVDCLLYTSPSPRD